MKRVALLSHWLQLEPLLAAGWFGNQIVNSQSPEIETCGFTRGYKRHFKEYSFFDLDLIVFVIIPILRDFDSQQIDDKRSLK